MSFLRKLAPIATGALLFGSTVMAAAAMDLATYPAPFVEGGKADVGIILGAVAATPDTIAAVDVATDLQANLAGVTTTTGGGVAGGEGVNLATSNTKLYYGSSINAARTTLTNNELATVLADGDVEDDGGTTYAYTQSITLGSSTINFSTSGADLEDPALLIQVGTTEDSPIYKYKIAFSKEINVSDDDVRGNNINIMGQDFTIGASSTNTTLYLYGTGTSITLEEGESSTVTVGGEEYEVSVDGVSSTTVGMVTVNGVTKEVTEGNIYKFGTLEVYAKNVFYLAKETQVSSIELSFGSNRLKLQDRKSIKQGSDDTTIKNTIVNITQGSSSGLISGFEIFQAAEKSKVDHLELGEEFVDRVFGTVKLVFKDTVPALDSAARDTILVNTDNSRNVRVTFTDAIYGTETTDFVFGHDSDTADSTVTPRLADSSNKTIHVVEGANVSEDEHIVINAGDYGRILTFTDTVTGEVTSTDYITFTDALSGESFNVYVGVHRGRTSNNTMNIDGQTYYVSLWNTTSSATSVAQVFWGSSANYLDKGDAYTVFPRIKLDRGEWLAFLTEYGVNATAIKLPGEYAKAEDISAVTLATPTYSYKVGSINWTARNDTTTPTIYGIDYNDDGTVDCNFNSTYGPAVLVLEEYMQEGTSYLDAICVPTDTSGTSTVEISVSTPKFESSTAYVPELVSLSSDTYKQQAVDRYGAWIEYDATDNDGVTILYPDEQMYCDVYIAEESAAITATSVGVSGGALGSVTVTDDEVSSVDDKNLVVFGGSAINKVSASLLGLSYPTYGSDSAWITATGVKSNMAIIKLFESPYAEDKVAMLIAGYEGKDTQAAAKALVAGTPEMSGESVLLSTVSASTVEIVEEEEEVVEEVEEEEPEE